MGQGGWDEVARVAGPGRGKHGRSAGWGGRDEVAAPIVLDSLYFESKMKIIVSCLTRF